MMLRTRPKCPNHGEYLEGLPFPMKEKGSGMCPVSGAMFAYEMELDTTEAGQTTTKDKDGNVKKVPGEKWILEGDETKMKITG